MRFGQKGWRALLCGGWTGFGAPRAALAAGYDATGCPGPVQIAGGNRFALLLSDDGTVWAAGKNDKGQLGNGTNDASKTFVQVDGLTDIVSIAAGADSGFAVDAGGSVYGWGGDAGGVRGTGASGDADEPVEVAGLNVVAVADGLYVAAGEQTAWRLRTAAIGRSAPASRRYR